LPGVWASAPVPCPVACEGALNMDDYILDCCGSGVIGCCGAVGLVRDGGAQSFCLDCVYEDNGCDAVTLLSHVEELLAAGHRVLEEAAGGVVRCLTVGQALEAARAYAALCPPFMDSTGGREWDCSRWLTALLSCEAGRRAVGLPAAPQRVLELGAGTGDLALALGSNPGFAAALREYRVTDVEGRVGAIRARIAQRGLEGVICAAELLWGTAVDEAFDVVLVCETLHWKGDMPAEEDTIAPLAATIASACRGRPTVALLAHRERCAEREASFYAMCRRRGLATEQCTSAAGLSYAPAEPHDPGVRGRLVLMRLRDSGEACEVDEG